MKQFRYSFALVGILFFAAAAPAASIDMDNPNRALAREGNIRIDAQLVRDTVSAGTAVGITCQIQNFSDASIAVADRVTDANYDEDSRTIVVGVGSEVPADGNLPHMVVIAPGEKKVFTAAATPLLHAAAVRSTLPIVPRFVQVKVAILRDVAPYLDLIQKQDVRAKQRLSDAQFDQWFESNDTIVLNTIPVRYQAPPAASDVERRQGGY
ncbi:MAG TPA: hypothetical protein VM733_01210 [Thermoanaerobaculia bacterium]|nr:hypothetical protein [Thermoanaerobaculia bacterium]